MSTLLSLSNYHNFWIHYYYQYLQPNLLLVKLLKIYLHAFCSSIDFPKQICWQKGSAVTIYTKTRNWLVNYSRLLKFYWWNHHWKNPDSSGGNISCVKTPQSFSSQVCLAYPKISLPPTVWWDCFATHSHVIVMWVILKLGWYGPKSNHRRFQIVTICNFNVIYSNAP